MIGSTERAGVSVSQSDYFRHEAPERANCRSRIGSKSRDVFVGCGFNSDSDEDLANSGDTFSRNDDNDCSDFDAKGIDTRDLTLQFMILSS